MKPSQGCCAQTYHIDQSQLPLACPLPTERIWDGHPRVYLPIEKKGICICPYCGTKYLLKKSV